MPELVLCHNCGEPAKYRGLQECARCYQRFQAHGDYDTHAKIKRPCVAPDCERPAKHYGWCRMHWDRLCKHQELAGGKWSRRGEGTCVVPICGGRQRAMGLCARHYSGESKRGHPLWRTPGRRKVHADRPWTAESVQDVTRLPDRW